MGTDEPPLEMSEVGEGILSGSEKTAACLAMISFWLCSVFGALLVLWWARRERSAFAYRYALVSLAMEGLMLGAMVVYLPVLLFAPILVVNIGFLVGWFLQLILVIYSIVLAVYAAKGRDVSIAPVPATFIRLLPKTVRTRARIHG